MDNKQELSEINARIENGTATGRDFNRRHALLAEITATYKGDGMPKTGGVCLPIANFTKGRVLH